MSGRLSLYRLLHGWWSRSPSLLPPGWGQSKNANKSCPPSWGLSKNTQKSFGLSSGTLLKSKSTNMWDFRFQVPPVCTDLCRGEYTVQTDRCQLEMITFYHQNMFHVYFSLPKNTLFSLSAWKPCSPALPTQHPHWPASLTASKPFPGHF